MSFNTSVRRQNNMQTMPTNSGMEYFDPLGHESSFNQPDLYSFPSIINAGGQFSDFNSTSNAPIYNNMSYGMPIANNISYSNQYPPPNEFVPQYSQPISAVDLYSFPKVIQDTQPLGNITQSVNNSHVSSQNAPIKTVKLEEILSPGPSSENYQEEINYISNQYSPGTGIYQNTTNITNPPVTEFIPQKTFTRPKRQKKRKIEPANPIPRNSTPFSQIMSEEIANKVNNEVKIQQDSNINNSSVTSNQTEEPKTVKRSFAALFAEEQAQSKNSIQTQQMQAKQANRSSKALNFEELIREEESKKHDQRDMYHYDHQEDESGERDEQFWA